MDALMEYVNVGDVDILNSSVGDLLSVSSSVNVVDSEGVPVMVMELV